VHVVAGCALLLLIVVAVIALVAAVIAFMKRDAAQHPRGSGTLGNALQEIEGLFVEGKENIVEAKRAEAEEADESGEPPEK
jgi:hypothetical protein